MKLLLFLFIGLYCVLCPYTKVEESFNLQAIHDVIHYGPDLTRYDHLEFPGVVPRTFVGSIVIGAISKAILSISSMFEYVPVDEQIVVRLVLGGIVSLGLNRFQTAVHKVYGSRASTAFTLLTCCQFHILFWSSRTLPNTLALPLVLAGLANWLESLDEHAPHTRTVYHRRMIWYMTIAGIVFRFEAGILLAILVGLEWLVYRTLPFKTWLVHGLGCALLSLVLTVSIDSYFWQRWLWPEGEVFYFNAILNKSSEWGTMPFYAYYVLFFPRLLLITYPLAIIAYVLNGRVRRMLLPSLLYINLFSCLPHKEWRFVMYTIPIWTAAAASLVASFRSRLKLLVVVAGALASLVTSLLMLYISMQNYPGGHALRQLHALENPNYPVKVHLDTPTAMTGASRFGELFRPAWSYWKTESHTTLDDYLEAEYTHLITSHPERFESTFEAIDVISGYDGVRIQKPRLTDDYTTLVPFSIVIKPKLTIMRLRNPQATWIQTALRNNQVVLYSKTYCPYCRRAKMILDKYCPGNYTVVEVDLRLDGLEMKKALYEITGRQTFPNVFVHGKSIGGSDDLVHLDMGGQLSNLLPCYAGNGN